MKWGYKVVDKIRMFSFVIYDKRKNEIFVCRDHTGIKPLYYYFDNNDFIFASEIKSLLKHPSVSKNINYGAIDLAQIP